MPPNKPLNSLAMGQSAPSIPIIAIYPDPPDDTLLQRITVRLSANLNLPLLKKLPTHGVEMLLAVTCRRLELRVLEGPKTLCGPRPIYCDLLKLDTHSCAGGRLRQPIARAVGIAKGKPRPAIIDATAGYGQDAWLLASLGCRVLAVERNRVVCALLRDGYQRAVSGEPDKLDRICIVQADTVRLLRHIAREPGVPGTGAQNFHRPDVVYLDPMFPTGRKTAERKSMRALRRLVGDNDDAGVLFDAAMQVALRRVVVKRPLRAEALGGKPVAVHHAKAARYDVYVP